LEFSFLTHSSLLDLTTLYFVLPQGTALHNCISHTSKSTRTKPILPYFTWRGFHSWQYSLLWITSTHLPYMLCTARSKSLSYTHLFNQSTL